MKAKEIIRINNKKRELLHEENVKDYEDMLMYIRLSSAKSEQQTEEILLELLEHILDAQEDGKTVRDVFGDDLKLYSQELIEEIPEETKKKQLRFSFRLVFLFLAVMSLFSGILDASLYYIFGIGEKVQTFHLGSSIANSIISLIIAFTVIYYLFKWIKDSTFKQEHKKKSSKVEFFQLWIVMTLVTSLFVALYFFMPSFGRTFDVPVILFIPIGLVLYGISYLLKE